MIYHVPHPQGKRTITQTADAGGLNVINHDHTLYRQISTCEENPTSPNGPNTHEAERDKSRPYTFHPNRFIAIICLQDNNNID